jgi:NADH-quinone oxidoreductase subunit I
MAALGSPAITVQLRTGKLMNVVRTIVQIAGSLGATLKHVASKRPTVQYPDVKPNLPPRYKGRIVLTRDPDGQERCVACYLCSAVCPVDCIAIQSTEASDGERRYPSSFRIDFARCIFCGMCEEACPTLAIQLTPDFEMCTYQREKLVYEKEDLLVEGTGKHPRYNFYHHAGVPIKGKAIGQAEHEAPPLDPYSNLP